MSEYEVVALSKMKNDIKYSFDGANNNTNKLDFEAINFQEYKNKFNKVQENIKQGNTYLLNLSGISNLKTKLSLKEIYEKSNSPNKLFYKDKFISFSPEKFIEINDNKISTYPMKGTINASIPNAKEKLLNNKKELAEHTMIVDLLRNDLSMVSNNVQVDRFRYIDKIKTSNKTLLQTSSKISGDLQDNWKDNLGSIIIKLLPAGSITGTPKINTIKLLKDIENYNRNFFTGIYGVFDGEALKSYVLIRFMEKQKRGNLVFKSGGGITGDSDVNDEYMELCDKIYM